MGFWSQIVCISEKYGYCSDGKVKLYRPYTCRSQIVEPSSPALQDASEHGYINCFDGREARVTRLMLAIQHSRSGLGGIMFETEIEQLLCAVKIRLSSWTSSSVTRFNSDGKDQVRFYKFAACSCINPKVMRRLQGFDTKPACSSVS